jgi:hypothetical protein
MPGSRLLDRPAVFFSIPECLLNILLRMPHSPCHFYTVFLVLVFVNTFLDIFYVKRLRKAPVA